MDVASAPLDETDSSAGLERQADLVVRASEYISTCASEIWVGCDG